MKIKGYKHILLFITMFVITSFAYTWFIQTSYFHSFIEWSHSHKILLIGILVSIKIIGIIWPPLPGGYFTLASVPAIGWLTAYFVDLTGSIIGSSIAYYLGKKYGYSFLKKIFDESILKKLQTTKVKKHRELETMFALRILGGGTITEAVCYAAGLLNIGVVNFMAGIIITHIMFGIPAFYFAENIFQTKNILTSYLFLIIAIPLWMKLKNRYFE